jgi:pyrimidine deaminase RibD-like protein
MQSIRHTPDRTIHLYGNALTDHESHSIDDEHLHDLLLEATKVAIEGAYKFGVDVPVGAATSENGRILAADYAKDNLIGDERAHAEYMALQKTHELHHVAEPDTIGVTLEPCFSCQKYISENPSIQLVTFVLPIAQASLRNIVRKKNGDIFQKSEQGELPFTVVQFEDAQLAKIGGTLLDFTKRNIETKETTVDLLGLHRALPAEFRL